MVTFSTNLVVFSTTNHVRLSIILVGGAITILKNMKVNGKDDIPYMKWTIKNV